MTATAKRLPWLKWYPADWRAETRLKFVSRAARSLWLDLIGLAHDAEPYGFLIVGGVALTDARLIAMALGDSESEIAPLLAELECRGVFSRAGSADLPPDVAGLISSDIAPGTILSRKLVRDSAKQDRNRHNGARGGNPKLREAGITGGLTHPDNPWVNQGVKAQIPEAREEERNETPLRGAFMESQNLESGPNRPEPSDAKECLFAAGLPWLARATGKREEACRPILAKLLNEDAKGNPSGLRAAIEAAQRDPPIDPIPWLRQGVKVRIQHVTADPFEATDAHGWDKRLAEFERSGIWLSKWGGANPGDHPGHLLPAVRPVFEKHGHLRGRDE